MEIKLFHCGYMGGNCYLVYDEEGGEAFMVDPGAPSKELDSYIEEKELNIKYIILTHGHGDHIGGVPHYREMFPDAKVIAGEDEKDMLMNSSSNFTRMTTGKAFGLEADIYTKDMEELEFAGTKLIFMATPGHTPGGISILMDDVLFSGDTLFRSSIGRTDFQGGSFARLEKSIREKLYTLPDDTRVLPGHEIETTIGFEKEHNPFV